MRKPAHSDNKLVADSRQPKAYTPYLPENVAPKMRKPAHNDNELVAGSRKPKAK